jgi:hypothetical protein
MITHGEQGWEKMLPEGISELIQKDRLFGYTKKRAR